MRARLYIFISYYIILGNQYDYINMKPMIGANVENALENEFPYVVSVIRVNQQNPNIITHACTGTLITRKDIATVENCVINENEDLMKVVVGSLDYQLGTRYPIQWWITYDYWAVFNGITIDFEVNDVANIRLIHTVPSAVRRLPFNIGSNYRLYSKAAEMVGWGVINGTEVSRQLKKVTVQIIPNRDCVHIVSRLANRRVVLDKSQAICAAAYPFAIMTTGDGGGPLVYRNKLIAINKGTVPSNLAENDPNLVNLFMSLEYYKLFFYSNMESTLI